jgi:HD-like signal output (HDOD) protein
MTWVEEPRLDTDNDARDRKADQIVQEIGIPPCPATLTRLLRETRADAPDFRRVGQFIGADVALASAVLKIANSPFYGLRTKASSVQQAVALLGLNAVTQLVTGLLLRQAFSGAAGPGMERYWKMSMAISLIAAMLCRETAGGDVGIACTYGLFRDCGMPVMLQKFPIYADIFDGTALASDDLTQEIENQRYPTNHARVGAQLARSWQLSDSMCFAILHHHDLPHSNDLLAQAGTDAQRLVAIGFAAEQLYCLASGEPSHDWAPAGEWALSELDLTAETFAAAEERVSASINRL